MPVTIDSAVETGVFSSIGVTIEGVRERGEGRYAIDVPAGTAGLVVTVTASGPDGVNREPSNAEVTLFTPGDSRAEFARGADGQYVFLDDNPMPGRWVLSVGYGSNASVELNATTVQPNYTCTSLVKNSDPGWDAKRVSEL